MKKIIIILAILLTTYSFAQQKAIEVNGKIKVYNQLPKKWETSNGTVWNFRSSDSITLASYGFKPLVTPATTNYQYLGVVYEDTINNVFTYPVIEIDITTIYNQKTQQANAVFNEYRNLIMQASYENLISGTVSTEFKALVTTLDSIKVRINGALKYYLDTNNIEDLANFSFDTAEAAQLKLAIKNFN